MRDALKVTAGHLARKAYLYVRQSTLRQVMENNESTQRQYALQQRAVALGWPVERIEVIDCDLGLSGSSSADRKGFQKLVTEVGMARAGIVLGLEASRLARNCSDWHHLLEICAFAGTLILDEDGLYDPGHFNDRLLLGLKGTMSEAELHILKARLRGGLLNKARRGELKTRLPVGFVYDSRDRVVLDPDLQVQDTVRLVFSTFRRLKSATATARTLREQGIQLPCRSVYGPDKGELRWDRIRTERVLEMLHSPRYAGAYFYGRTRKVLRQDGAPGVSRLPRDQWLVLLQDAHPGYISWDEHLGNTKCLQENSKGAEGRRAYPPREGPALLQGIAICGLCGSRMTVRYTVSNTARASLPYYICQRSHFLYGKDPCQHVPGEGIDEAIGELLLDTLTPLAIETALKVQTELQSRLDQADRIREQQVERVRFECDLARRRFMQVDPDNRLVADTLEAEWNTRLRELAEAQKEYERRRAADRKLLNSEQSSAIQELAADFPRVWNHPATPHRERKRIVRLLLEDVTILKSEEITIHIRFRGGTAKTLNLLRPLPAGEKCRTPPEIIEQIDTLLESSTDREVAEILNARGLRSGRDNRFSSNIVKEIRNGHGLKSRSERLREKGLLTPQQIGEKLGVTPARISVWRKRGILKAHRANEKGEYFYEEPEQIKPPRGHHTDPGILKLIDELLDEHTEQDVAKILNQRGYVSGTGMAFTRLIVQALRSSHGLKTRRRRLQERGFVSTRSLADKLGVSTTTILNRMKQGLLQGHKIGHRGGYMFATTSGDAHDERIEVQCEG
ncbi:MAG: recombinase family protein [Vulcanimicrobiota bacterium]